jgi:demethylmenaquinone methyltransferase/2-methoxy-6-polyprenyl-1,4-benzoquinol methylase
MPRNFRRKYYDFFSKFYDNFAALHSRDRGGDIREEFAAKAGLRRGDTALDICTGTGSLLLSLHRHVGADGRVVGIDFSMGMLRAAKMKAAIHPNIHLLQADAAELPFKQNALKLVTCSHAFYELKGDTRNRCLQEVSRVLKEDGCFLMMEHDIPKNLFIRFLFYLRIFSLGSRKALGILKNEETVFHEHFASVVRTTTGTGRSKIFTCQKARSASALE